jgi:hypothetical protein
MIITCDRSHLEERCLQRGYSFFRASGCVVSSSGDILAVDTDHVDYPAERVGALSFKCVPDCTASEFACGSGECCVELPDGSNGCQVCSSSSSSSSVDCVQVTVDVSKLYYEGVGFPDCPPSGTATLCIPKQLTMSVDAGCFGSVTSQFNYLPAHNVWGLVYNPPAPFQEEYDLNPTSDNLQLANPTVAAGSMHSLRLFIYELFPGGNWDVPGIGPASLDGRLPIHVSYSGGAYNFVKAAGTTFTKKTCSGCSCSDVPARCPYACGPVSPNSDLYNSYGYSSADYSPCESIEDLLNNISVEVS